MVGRLVDDVRLGWRSGLREMLAGAACALPVSGLVAIGLGATGIDGSWLVLLAGGVQLVLGYAIAGWLVRRGGK